MAGSGDIFYSPRTSVAAVEPVACNSANTGSSANARPACWTGG